MESLTWFLLGNERAHPPPQVRLALTRLTRFSLHTEGLQKKVGCETAGNLKLLKLWSRCGTMWRTVKNEVWTAYFRTVLVRCVLCSSTTPTSHFMRLALRALGQVSGVWAGCLWAWSCSLFSLVSMLSMLTGLSNGWTGFWTHWREQCDSLNAQLTRYLKMQMCLTGNTCMLKCGEQ